MTSATPQSDRHLRLGWAALSFAVATAVLALAIQPSPRLSLERHWREFGIHALVAGLVLVPACAVVGRRSAVCMGVAFLVMLAGAAMMHPVCVLIPPQERPAFESVATLRERAAAGECFYELESEWYQCKSVIARSMFF